MSCGLERLQFRHHLLELGDKFELLLGAEVVSLQHGGQLFLLQAYKLLLKLVKFLSKSV